MEQNPTLVRQIIAANLAANQAAYDDTDTLVAEIARLVPDVDETLAAELGQIYVDAGIWPVDGGLSPEGVETTLAALADNGLIEEVPDAAEVYDRSLLDEALAQGN